MAGEMSLDAFLASPLVQLNFVGLAGIVVWRLIPGRRANTRLVVQIAFFVVMTAILVGNDIAPHRFEGDAAEDASALLVVSAKLLWWVHLAWAIKLLCQRSAGISSNKVSIRSDSRTLGSPGHHGERQRS